MHSDAERLTTVLVNNVCEMCKAGDLAQLQRWHRDGRLPKLVRNYQSWYPHDFAAAYGHLDVLKWLFLHSGQTVDLTADDNFAVQIAAEFGQLHILQWLVNDSGQAVNLAARENSAIRAAVSKGHLAVVRWMIEASGQVVDATARHNVAFRQAARDGHAEMLHWLILESGQCVPQRSFEEYAFFQAAQHASCDVTTDALAAMCFQLRDKFKGSVSELHAAACLLFGRDPAVMMTKTQITAECTFSAASEQPEVLALHLLLDHLEIPFDLASRSKYFQSKLCRSASRQQVITTVAQLNRLWQTEQHAAVTSRARRL